MSTTDLDLIKLVSQTTESALLNGALQPIETDFEIIRDGGLSFLVRIARNIQRKAHNNQDQTRKRTSNPFLPYDEALFVTELSNSHVCLLNKFNVVEKHLLIVTKQYESQDGLLTEADFNACVAPLMAADGLVFYNGGREAGASQQHKHLQFIPTQLIPGMQHLPIEAGLGTNTLAAGELINQQHPFPHSLFIFSPAFFENDRHEEKGHQPVELMGSYFYNCYQHLINATGIKQEDNDNAVKPYNLLLTRRWMLLVARTAECFESISFNAMAFAGSFFLRDAKQLSLLKQSGPIKALNAVS